MLAEALLAQGWSVWWDWQIPAGKTFDLYYAIYEAKKDLEGVRKRVVYSRDAAPLFKLPAGRYYVIYGDASASTEVEIAAGERHELKLEIKMP
jgi:hypothetical protein